MENIKQFFIDWEVQLKSKWVIKGELDNQENSLGPISDDHRLIHQIFDKAHEQSTIRLKLQTEQNQTTQLRKLIVQKSSSSDEQIRLLQEQHAIEMEQHSQQLEGAIQKNFQTIKTLITDKQCLSEQVEVIAQQQQKQNEEFTTRIKRLKLHYEQELTNQKDQLKAKEKSDREKWEKEKTTKIRELTIKGLEPELQGMMEKHELELKKVKLEFQQKFILLRKELTQTPNKNSIVKESIEINEQRDQEEQEEGEEEEEEEKEYLDEQSQVRFYQSFQNNSTSSPQTKWASKKLQSPLIQISETAKNTNQSTWLQQQQIHTVSNVSGTSSQLLFQIPSSFLAGSNKLPNLVQPFGRQSKLTTILTPHGTKKKVQNQQ